MVTTIEGEIQILPGHASLVGVLGTGRITYTLVGEKPVTGIISTGFVSVEEGSVKVVAETIELSGEIDLNRAKLAQQKAQQALADASLSEAHFKKYQLKLQRAIIRQEIANH